MARHVRARVGRGRLRGAARRERRLLRHDQRRHHAQPDAERVPRGPREVHEMDEKEEELQLVGMTD